MKEFKFKGGRGHKFPFEKCTVRTIKSLIPIIKELEYNYLKKNSDLLSHETKRKSIKNK